MQRPGAGRGGSREGTRAAIACDDGSPLACMCRGRARVMSSHESVGEAPCTSSDGVGTFCSLCGGARTLSACGDSGNDIMTALIDAKMASAPSHRYTAPAEASSISSSARTLFLSSHATSGLPVSVSDRSSSPWGPEGVPSPAERSMQTSTQRTDTSAEDASRHSAIRTASGRFPASLHPASLRSLARTSAPASSRLSGHKSADVWSPSSPPPLKPHSDMRVSAPASGDTHPPLSSKHVACSPPEPLPISDDRLPTLSYSHPNSQPQGSSPPLPQAGSVRHWEVALSKSASLDSDDDHGILPGSPRRIHVSASPGPTPRATPHHLPWPGASPRVAPAPMPASTHAPAPAVRELFVSPGRSNVSRPQSPPRVLPSLFSKPPHTHAHSWGATTHSGDGARSTSPAHSRDSEARGSPHVGHAGLGSSPFPLLPGASVTSVPIRMGPPTTAVSPAVSPATSPPTLRSPRVAAPPAPASSPSPVSGKTLAQAPLSPIKISRVASMPRIPEDTELREGGLHPLPLRRCGSSRVSDCGSQSFPFWGADSDDDDGLFETGR